MFINRINDLQGHLQDKQMKNPAIHYAARPMIALFTALILILSGCSSAPAGDTKSNSSKQTAVSIDEKDVQSLLSAAEFTPQPKANELRLQAVKIALERNNVEQAKNILLLVSEPTNRNNLRTLTLLKIELAIQSEDPNTALSLLQSPKLQTQPLTQQDQLVIGQLRARAFYLARSYLASARERVFFDDLLATADQQKNREAIFNTLMELPVRTLSQQASKAVTSDLRGWLSLAAMTKQFQNDPIRQLQELARWQTAWSNHPAALTLPPSLSSLKDVVNNQPKAIALVLPLNGGLSSYGRAIRDAIIATRFETNSQIKIQVYDSTSEEITSLINRAVQEGAELIIGPLERKKVTAIAAMQEIPAPVLALNRTHDGTSHADLYQFGLAPEDEMVQVADQVFKEGKKNALAIYPDTQWGERNFEAFQNRWTSLGGNITGTAPYEQQRDYSTLIKSILDIDNSEERAADLRRILGQRFEFTPRRRQDIDFVFLLGNQAQARGINPTLAFFYADDIPVYSTSHIYEASDTRIESIDLNRIRFCDIPWKLTNNEPIQLAINEQWPASASQLAPFYALGVDSFRLYPRLNQLRQFPETKVYGSTGVLQLNPYNVLVRKLMWAQFTDGEVVTSPMVISPTNGS